MKVLAFSDLHLSRTAAAALVEAAAGADLVIGAGDFCNRREGLDEAIVMLAGIAAPMVLVPGNCESADELRAAAPAGASVLHGQGCEIGGLRLFGLGYGVPVTPFGAWSCDLTEDQAADLLAPCGAVDVMVFHSPPKGIADVTGTGISVGSTAIRDAIARVQPKLAVCGHVHDCWGQEGRIGETRVVNLGPTVNWFEIGD
ncbi:metallophosphoesterase family protein [Rhodovulum marinum]|uniref:Icc-related predicted phosphoesterase n=1 Tax=Rhodovulum marinum TaxID=320662 RepID=A0A4R2Q7H6_9RHOB|nr:metallophosphoesterase family protein [Rhodovulum marinum]TCP44499.1 Icc-related predicted phosphoesterase [Rhodovulum marinum]